MPNHTTNNDDAGHQLIEKEQANHNPASVTARFGEMKLEGYGPPDPPFSSL